jgi:Flp pilus assembly protein TadG
MRLVRTSGRRSAAPLSGGARASDGQGASDGQSLVEFSLVLMPLFFILLGIIQFGFIFNSYVTLTNAVREGARTGTIYLYSASLSKAQNDLARNEAIRTAVKASMNLLSTTSPRFTTTGTWLSSGGTYANGDLIVAYVVPTGVTDTDSRVGEQVTVRATYHQDLVIPLIDHLLPRDSGGRLALGSEVTMVIN